MTPSSWTWDEVKARYPVGAEVDGTATWVAPFGVFVDLGIGFAGLMLLPECGLERCQQTSDVFRVGDAIWARVLCHNDERQQISLKRRAQEQ